MGQIFFYNIVRNQLDISFGIETKTLIFKEQVKISRLQFYILVYLNSKNYGD